MNINDGSGLSTLISDTAATVEFGGNGQANGNAGCNTFNAPYSVNGSSINIGVPSSGMAFCAEPEGLMAQEANYFWPPCSPRQPSASTATRSSCRTAAVGSLRSYNAGRMNP